MDREAIRLDERVDHAVDVTSPSGQKIIEIYLKPGYRFRTGEFTTTFPPRAHECRAVSDSEVVESLNKIIFCYCEACRTEIVRDTLQGHPMDYLRDWKNAIKSGQDG